jgi:hypothetical protein
MSGTSTFALTGLTRLRLTLSKIPMATMRALADPCFPGFDFSYETADLQTPQVRRVTHFSIT